MTHPWKRNYPAEGGDLTNITINIPREMRNWLEQKCAEMKVHPWKLICIALDNEREQPKPFDYPLDPPSTVYVEHAYRDEAVRIYQFLQKWKYGLGIEVLLFFRAQIGIPNRDHFLLALREAMVTKLVIASEDFKKRPGIEYPPGYKMIRAVNFRTATATRIENQREKMLKLEAKLKRQRQKLEIMEGAYDAKTDNRSPGSQSSNSGKADE